MDCAGLWQSVFVLTTIYFREELSLFLFIKMSYFTGAVHSNVAQLFLEV